MGEAEGAEPADIRPRAGEGMTLSEGGRRPLVVICAGTPWDAVAGSDQMLARELLRHARVLWVDPEFSVLTRRALRQGTGRRLMPGLDEPVAGVTRLRPVGPPLHTRVAVRAASRALLRRQVGWALRRLGERPYAVFDCRLGRLLEGWEPGVCRVFYGTDDFVSGAELMGRDVAAVRRDERATLDNADLVVAVSEVLLDRWQGMGARRVVLVPNGVTMPTPTARGEPGTDRHPVTGGGSAAADDRLPGPVAGVVGQLSSRIDIGILEAVADAGISLLLVGPRDARWEPGRFERLVARPHVRWVGRQPHESLPGYLALLDVGLTPYVDSAFNRASFPLKTLEYLAAGRPVVSTALPATRWLDTDLIELADGPAQFVAAVRRLVPLARQPDLVAARRALAARHSWRARADQVAAAIGLSTGSPAGADAPAAVVEERTA